VGTLEYFYIEVPVLYEQLPKTEKCSGLFRFTSKQVLWKLVLTDLLGLPVLAGESFVHAVYN
jgi:hypothetical protein